MKAKIKKIKADKRFGYPKWDGKIVVNGKKVKPGTVVEVDAKEFDKTIMTKVEDKNE